MLIKWAVGRLTCLSGRGSPSPPPLQIIAGMLFSYNSLWEKAKKAYSTRTHTSTHHTIWLYECTFISSAAAYNNVHSPKKLTLSRSICPNSLILAHPLALVMIEHNFFRLDSVACWSRCVKRISLAVFVDLASWMLVSCSSDDVVMVGFTSNVLCINI